MPEKRAPWFVTLAKPGAPAPGFAGSTAPSVVHERPNTCRPSSRIGKRPCRRRPVRRVRFVEPFTNVVLSSRNDMETAPCTQSSWYSNAELAQIQQEIRRDCEFIRRHQLLQHSDSRILPPDTATFTSRGIEHLASVQVFQQLREDQTRRVRRVLEEQRKWYKITEQQFQNEDNGSVLTIPNPNRLAAKSSAVSANAVARAIAKGVADQEFVATASNNIP